MATVASYPASTRRAERMIAGLRVVMGAAGFLAIWLDPADPERYIRATYLLQLIYVGYACVLASLVWFGTDREWSPLVTHAIDISVFSAIQFLAGPTSPLFIYFTFSIFVGALRWGWRGTLRTAGVVMASFLAMTAVMSVAGGPYEFELNRFIIRMANLVLTAGVLVYLGRHEEGLRDDIERLARWPSPVGVHPKVAIEQVMTYAAGIVCAERAVAIWESAEEPRVQMATWSREGFALSSHAPGAFGAPIAAVPRALPPEMASGTSDAGWVSAAIKTERVSGRVFFAHDGTSAAEIIPLTEVVARQIGASLDQLHATDQLKAMAATEERIRVARDLHDGVLQSLTGIRLEIRALAGSFEAGVSQLRERLFAIERALAIEQRELRFFITGLGSAVTSEAHVNGTLAGRLGPLRERIALEWKTPVSIRVVNEPPVLSEALESSIPLMVHEAVVNALKHGEPSRVSVTIDGEPNEVRIVVSDDGRGFPFTGRLNHDELMRGNEAPKSLLDRMNSFGGRMSIESSATGSRVEMRVSLSHGVS